MNEYPNQNKQLNINFIDPQKMSLEDNSSWQFLDATPPPSTWQAGDQVVIEKTEGRFQSKSMYKVINKTRKDQDRPAVYLGGGISKEQIIEINKSLKDYPVERLDREWRIERLLEDGSILLEDRSVWQLTGLANKDMGEWDIGQVVRISKGSSGLRTYHMENLDINRPPFIVSFLGFQK